MTRRWSWRVAAGLLLAGWLLGGVALAAPLSVTDFTGHTVRLAHPARRIVALTPHLVENLFTAGLGKRIVATVAHADYPPAARQIPRVGGYDSVSLEAIVAKKPDLVVAWADGGQPDLIRRLRALGIAVYVDNPRRFAGIARTLRDLGHLGGTEATANAAARAFMQRVARLRARYAHRRPVRLFYEVWSDPLRTLSSGGMTGAVIRLCGGRNIFANAATLAPQVSIESVIARNPQAIVAAGVARDNPRWKRYWRQWPTIAAVRQDNFVTVPPDLISRPTVRLAKGAADLCRGLDRARHNTAGN